MHPFLPCKSTKTRTQLAISPKPTVVDGLSLLVAISSTSQRYSPVDCQYARDRCAKGSKRQQIMKASGHSALGRLAPCGFQLSALMAPMAAPAA